MSKENGMFYAMVFFVFVPMIIMSMAFGANAVRDLDVETAVGIKDTVNYTVEDNWNGKGVIDGLSSNGDILYAGQNQQGTWTSYIQYVPRNRILELDYVAQIEDGNGDITVRAWADDPEGNFSNPDASTTFDMMTGEYTETLNYTQYNYFDVVVALEETGGNANQLPHVDSLNVDFNIEEEKLVGIETGTMLALFYVLLLLAVSNITIVIFKVLSE